VNRPTSVHGVGTYLDVHRIAVRFEEADTQQKLHGGHEVTSLTIERKLKVSFSQVGTPAMGTKVSAVNVRYQAL